MQINEKLTKNLRKLIDNKVIVDTLFNGIGTKATNATDFFTTAMTKNPLDYDFVVITLSNSGNQYEEMNVVMTPKTDTNGIVVYFAATTQYYAYLRIMCAENSIKHRIMEVKTWGLSNVYIKQVLGIKISN
ncbi:MAG: hypothetical protein Q4E39_03965 [bacterium]|nr:hypothetical protein [bacterium]